MASLVVTVDKVVVGGGCVCDEWKPNRGPWWQHLVALQVIKDVR